MVLVGNFWQAKLTVEKIPRGGPRRRNSVSPTAGGMLGIVVRLRRGAYRELWSSAPTLPRRGSTPLSEVTACPQSQIPPVSEPHLRLALEPVASSGAAKSLIYWIVGKIEMVNGTKEFAKGLDTE